MKQISIYSLCALSLATCLPTALNAQNAAPVVNSTAYKPVSPKIYSAALRSMRKLVSEKKNQEQLLAKVAELSKQYPNNIADIIAASLIATNPDQQFAADIVKTALQGASPEAKKSGLAAAKTVMPAFTTVFTSVGTNADSPLNQPLGDGTPQNTIINQNPSGNLGGGANPNPAPIVPKEDPKPPVSAS